MTVSADATALAWFLPESLAQANELLDGCLVDPPTAIYLCNESSGDAIDAIGALDIPDSSGMTYQNSITGFTRKALGTTAGGGGTPFISSNAGLHDPSTTSALMFALITVDTPADSRVLFGMGGAASHRGVAISSSGQIGCYTHDGTTFKFGNSNVTSAVHPVVMKVDRSRSEFKVYTDTETITATWVAPSATDKLMCLGSAIGTNPGVRFLYVGYWTGAAAEMSDEQVAALMRRLQFGSKTTLATLQSGESRPVCYVIGIEGCKYLVGDRPASWSETVLHSWQSASGGDWTSYLPGAYVELRNTQKLDQWSPFCGSGSCKIRMVDTSAADTFGTFLARRINGAESTLSATCDRNDTTLSVSYGSGFSASGDVSIGTETIGYSARAASSITVSTRGKYSPFGCASSGSGGSRFANHHRVGIDPNQVQLRPAITQTPRKWIGKRVGVWMHTFDEENTEMNSRASAQLVFAGRIRGIADDPASFSTVLDVEHLAETDVRNAVLGRDMWRGEIAEGFYMATGRTFQMNDWKDGSATRTANALTVVASGASTHNEMNAGYYSLSEMCEKLSAWAAGEAGASRLYGTYSFQSPINTNDGLRTVIEWKIADAGTIATHFNLHMPGDVAAILGFAEGELGTQGQSFNVGGIYGTSNVSKPRVGSLVPYRLVVFAPNSPGRQGQEFSEISTYEADNQQGTFVDQYDLLPASIKEHCASDRDWGLFMLDEKSLMVGSYADSVLTNCWLAPFQLTADNSVEAVAYIGRRADEPEAGPVTLRQVFMLEASMATLLLKLFYSSGTSGYNHSTYDTLGYGLGLGIPGELLGGEFERSVNNIPGANYPLCVTIEEPTKFDDLLDDDLVLRRSFLRWVDQHFEFKQWQTPSSSVAAGALTEANKAAPSNSKEDHRSPSVEETDAQRPIIKIDYSRDFAAGRKDQYLKSVLVEDQVAVDDAGGNVKPYPLQLRNTYHQFANTGAGVEALLSEFIAFAPCVTEPQKVIVRSIDQRFWEGYSVGDVFEVTDNYARDPLTGSRGIDERPAIVSRHSYDPGGPSPDGSVRPMTGEVELTFMDLQRGQTYSPAAQVDDTQTNAGYTDATKTLICYAHKYSHTLTISTHRGERTFSDPVDVANFEAGDKILIIEMDPADPAAPDYWERTIDSVSGNNIVLTATLSSPAWSSSKKYRITYQKYSQVTGEQQNHSFQADAADEMIEDTIYANQPSGNDGCGLGDGVGSIVPGFTPNTGTESAELIPDLAHGDGRPWDPGFDRAFIHTANALIDYKTAHQNPTLVTGVKASFSGPDPVSGFRLEYVYPVFFGTEHLSASCTRVATLAPWFWSTDGTEVSVRVTLTDTMPVLSMEDIGYGAPVTGEARFTGKYDQATWTTTSTSEVIGSDSTLSLATKDIFFGYAFVCIELGNKARCRGLGKLIEGPRVVT